VVARRFSDAGIELVVKRRTGKGKGETEEERRKTEGRGRRPPFPP
jgi:hypothetical protein